MFIVNWNGLKTLFLSIVFVKNTHTALILLSDQSKWFNNKHGQTKSWFLILECPDVVDI